MGVYGPNDSKGRTQVWKEISGILEGHRGMLAGDFNMVRRREDRIPFKDPKIGREEKEAWDDLLVLGRFVELGLDQSVPTWSNRQLGDKAILKRLDRSYVVNFPWMVGLLILK